MDQLQEHTLPYGTIEEAYEALPEQVKLHSIRVAEYMEVMYDTALEIGLDLLYQDIIEDLDVKYNDFAASAGKYHDIGMIGLTEEQKQEFLEQTGEQAREPRNHVELGIQIAEALHKIEGSQSEERERWWEFLTDGIRCHHEKPDGTGYPAGIRERDIPLTAWFVVVADELDLYTAHQHCEKAFEKGYDRLLQSYEKALQDSVKEAEQTNEDSILEEILLVVRYSKNRLHNVFKRHIDETEEINYRTPLLKHKKNRIMQMQYRPARHLENNQIVALSAKMTFRMKKEYLEFEELYPLFQKQKSTVEIWKYFLYEVSDLVERVDAHDMKQVVVQMPLPVAVANQAKTAGVIKKWLEETEADTSRILFVLEEEALQKPTKTMLNNIGKIEAMELHFAVGNYTGLLTQEQLESFGIQTLLLGPGMLDHMDIEKKEQFKTMIDSGYKIQADGIEDDSYREDLLSMRILSGTGSLLGTYQTDDEMLG